MPRAERMELLRQSRVCTMKRVALVIVLVVATTTFAAAHEGPHVADPPLWLIAAIGVVVLAGYFLLNRVKRRLADPRRNPKARDLRHERHAPRSCDEQP